VYSIGVVIVEGKGVNLGRPIVINGAFVTQLFSNYFRQYLFLILRPVSVAKYCNEYVCLSVCPLA